jgi:hypothetical protein
MRSRYHDVDDTVQGLPVQLTLLRRTAEAAENRTFGVQAAGIDTHDERLLISSKASQESPPATWIVIRSAEYPSVPKVGQLSFLPRCSSIQLMVVGHCGFQLSDSKSGRSARISSQLCLVAYSFDKQPRPLGRGATDTPQQAFARRTAVIMPSA